jgi:hypothetical protein
VEEVEEEVVAMEVMVVKSLSIPQIQLFSHSLKLLLMVVRQVYQVIMVYLELVVMVDKVV